MRGSREDDGSADLDDVERRLRAIRDDPEKSTTLRELAQYQLERVAALRAARHGTGTPAVTVDRLGPFRFSAIPATGIVSVEIDRGDGLVPLVAVVSADEIRRLTPLFQHVREHAAAGESIRIDLREAFLDLLGHDPFDGQLDDR
ncbi:hypothetical protein [Plantactinospora endophytica]|uniref:YbaB/EbfC family DNA-binding protein n=1 Tax=Plantactinospora endophytica TaxID=673535 RepID=A0ABQ4E1W8_9ACTN|nr:hypothetical protein [Plantactinospora endophytica]GIG88662.1 hypothetical protein Pen02_35980 [Plantactinospora endophytica]